jgi:Dolichyl-phosphate-mannose-protein mannosyltransferase
MGKMMNASLANVKKPRKLSIATMLPGSAWLTIALAAVVFIYVNPFRETEVDDDWAYALTVRHLLDSGQYHLQDSATANMPFQAYWGALFADIGGYSHGNLRLSTLVLWAFGLGAFYLLCCEHGSDRGEAGLLVLGLFSCPLIVKMSFSFMTDIPYLSCLIIALFMYTRALRLRRYELMFLASIAGSAAILTRQFGAVLIAAVMLVWALSDSRRRNAALLATGIALPLVALGWQLRTGIAQPTGGTRMIFYQLSQYYSHPLALVKSAAWRGTVILHYFAFFALPFIFLPALERLSKRRCQEPLARRWLVPALIAGCMLCVLFYSRLHHVVPTSIPMIDSNFDSLWAAFGSRFRIVLTVLTTVGGALAASCFITRYRVEWRQMPPHERLIDYAAVGAALGILAYSNFTERYLLPLLPYLLIVLGRKCAPQLRDHGRLIATCCVLIVLISAVYTRSDLARGEAFWKGGDIALRSATPQENVSSSDEWDGFHYADTFLAQNSSKIDFKNYDGFVDDWLSKQRRRASYIVALQPPTDPSWTVSATVSYWPVPFVERRVYVLKRVQ